jgi:hypothetical protein
MRSTCAERSRRVVTKEIVEHTEPPAPKIRGFLGSILDFALDIYLFCVYISELVLYVSI